MNQDIKLKRLEQDQKRCIIKLTGSIGNVLTSVVNEGNAQPRTPAMTGYSLGLGAFGPNFQSVSKQLGELCTSSTMTGVLTSGDENKPLAKPGLGTRFYTPFNVAIGKDFNETYGFHSEKTITISALFDELISYSRRHPKYTGLIGVSLIFEIESFFGSIVKRSPLSGSIDDGKIIDHGRYNDWFKIDTECKFNGCRAVSVGVALDLQSSVFPEDMLKRIFYIHPANKNTSDKMLHNHCFILDKGHLPSRIGAYNSAVAGLLGNNEIIDIKHMLDNSTMMRGFAAVSQIQEIIDFK